MELLISAIVFIITMSIYILNILFPITLIIWFLNLLGVITLNNIGTILLVEIGIYAVVFLILMIATLRGWLPSKK